MLKISATLIVWLALFSSAAIAQTGRENIAEAKKMLMSQNQDEVLGAIQSLASTGTKDGVAPLIQLLRTGPRNDITDAIIQALGVLADQSAVGVLIEYLNHRRAGARLAAIYSLESFSSTEIAEALEKTLGDSDKQVREAAAVAIGKMKSSRSVPILFKALERGIDGAAISIGQLGGPGDAERMAGYLGKFDITTLLPGFDEFLKRDDFPKEAKVKILERLFELAGPEVRRFAVAYQASFPPGTDENDELFKLVSQMVRQIQGE